MNVTDIIMAACIALIMFGIGLELKFKDFKHVLFKPKAVISGLAAQIILLPLIALLLVYFWPMKPIYKVGIMLLAACPGGTSSNLVTKILKGRVALAVSMTAFNSFIILFSIPIILKVSYSIFGLEAHNVNLSFWHTMKEVTKSVVAPVILGIFVGRYFLSDRQKEKLHQPLNYILAGIMLVAAVTAVFFDKDQKNINYIEYLPLILPLIILNFITMVAGFLTSGKLMKLRHDSSYTIAIEIGLQNSVLALYIGNELLNSKEISLIAILYASFSLISTFGVAYFLKKSSKMKRLTSERED